MGDDSTSSSAFRLGAADAGVVEPGDTAAISVVVFFFFFLTIDVKSFTTGGCSDSTTAGLMLSSLSRA